MTPKGLVIALTQFNDIPYISARAVLDAMRNPDPTHKIVGVSVCNSELKLCGRILVGESAFTKHDEYGEAAMPGAEVSTSSSSSTFWRGGAEAGHEAQQGDRLIAADVGGSPPSSGGHMSAIRQDAEASTGGRQSAKTKGTTGGLLSAVSKGGAKTEAEEADNQIPTSAGETGPDDNAGDTDTEWERDENETVPVRRVFRDEANSVARYLLHRPGLPQHCEECRRAKTKRKKRFCKTFSEKVPDATYGTSVTSDHVNFKDVYKNRGVDGYVEAVTFLDRHSNFRLGQPVKSKDHDDTFESLQFMKGREEWQRMYSDNEGWIKTACEQLGVLWDPCQPGIHQSNGVIENTNLQIVYDIKVTLCAAGLPACAWPYAIAFRCMLHETPWTTKFGEDFQGDGNHIYMLVIKTVAVKTDRQLRIP